MKIIIFVLLIIIINGEDKGCGMNCVSCNGNLCEKCEIGFSLRDGKCFNLCDNCEKCENGKCLKCISEYMLVNDKCYSNVLII